jgi:hypothetical protein
MRNRFLKLLMTLMLASTLHPGVAQNDEMSEEETSGYIPTPQTWAFIKYGNSPVDYYTGTAQVNVPIYDYADNDFQFSISAGYASTGFMPQRQTGILGLNWFLNCGGSITREIKGFPDDMVKKADQEYFGFLLGRNSYDDDDVLQQPNGNYNVGIPGYNVNFVETESDIYHFNFMGHSGSFVYNGRREVCVFNTNGRHGTYKIEYNKKDNGQIESYRGIKSFTITTEDGYCYFFGDDDIPNGVELQIPGNFTSYGNYKKQNQNDQPTVTWFLKKITAPNGRVMLFEYDSYNSITLGDINSTTSCPYYVTSFSLANNYVQIGPDPGTGGNPGEIDPKTNLYRQASIIKTSYLKKVIVKNGTTGANDLVVNLTYSTKSCKDATTVSPTTQDARALANIAQYLKQLDEISVQNGQLEELCNCKFSYRTKDQRLILDAINISGLGAYKMSYYEEYPYPEISTSDVDFWGYYNGKGNAYSNIASTTIAENQYDETIAEGNDSHNPDWRYSLIGCLQQIQYPTQGFTTFEYEPNAAYAIVLKNKSVQLPDQEIRDDFVGDNFFVPAYDVNYEYLSRLNAYSALFENSDETGGVRIKKITDYDGFGGYVTREFRYSGGIVSYFPRFYSYGVGEYNCWNPYLDIPANSFDKSHIGYRTVSEIYADGSSVEYRFNDYVSHPDDYEGQQRKKVWNMPNSSVDTVFLDNIQRAPNSRHNERGRINHITYYNSDKQAVRRVYTEYEDVGREHSTYVKMSGQYAYMTMNYIGDCRPTSTMTTDYWGNDSLSTRTVFKYNRYGQDSVTRVIRPDGRIIATHTDYLHEYPDVYPESNADQGIIMSLLYRKYKVDEDPRIILPAKYLIDAQRISYDRIGSQDQNLIKPTQVEVMQMQNPVLYRSSTQLSNAENFKRIRSYNAYDSMGNPVQIEDASGITTSYLWGYGGLYPIVKATGVTYQALKQLLGINSDSPLDGAVTDQQKAAIMNAQNGLWNIYYYEPAVGLTRHLDPSGRETIYNYDSFGRLISIEDGEGVLEEYEYHMNTNIY